LVAAIPLLGCRLDMHVQPRYNPYDPSSFFSDGRSERPPVPGTVARTEVLEAENATSGKAVNAFPFEITRSVVERGRERFDIFCAPCHGLGGNGDGIIVQRGFERPPSYHTERLRNAPSGHFFDVITNGFGAMYPYGYRVPVPDRWAIVAYIRALQLSQNTSINDLRAPERQRLLSESP
jgi:hypothetical protein